MKMCVKCGTPLPPRGSRGPERVYCSSRCRQAALRERGNAVAVDMAGDGEGKAAVSESVVEMFSVDVLLDRVGPDDRLARAILEGRNLSKVFRDVSGKVKKPIGVRAERVAVDIQQTLDRNFGGAE